MYRFRLTPFRVPCNNEDIASEGRSRGKGTMSSNFALTVLAVFAFMFTAFTVAYVSFYYFTTTERGFDYMERRAAIKRNRRK